MESLTTAASYAPSNGTTETTPPGPTRRIHFHEIEHAIIKFSGDDKTYGVQDFLAHLEQIFSQVNADEVLKSLALRNSLTGTARLLLTRGAINYDDLKVSLLKEFGSLMSRQEIFQTLRNRGKRPGESVRRYIMEMEAIAHRSDVTEFELVVFIQEGLNHRISDYTLFSAARTIDELKQAVSMFEQRQAVRGLDAKADAPVIKSKPQARNSQSTIPSSTTTEDRCFNCSRMGHRKTNCPYEDRPRNVCFNCWHAGHDRKTCRNPKYNQKLKPVVGAVEQDDYFNDDADDDGVKSIAALQLVSVAFVDTSGRCGDTVTRLCLLDTGSPINLARRSSIPFDFCNNLKQTRFYGLGKFQINTYGKVNCFAIINGRREKLTVLVIPDDLISVPMLLGRPALRKFNIVLKMLNQRKGQTIMLNKEMNSINNKDEWRFSSLTTGVTEGEDTASTNSMKTDVLNRVEKCAMRQSHNINVPNNRSLYSGEKIMDDDLLVLHQEKEKKEIDINPFIGKDNADQIRKIITDGYLYARFNIDPITYEMKIRLNSDLPFRFAPRKLSFIEREALRDITNDLIRKGVIRPSDSAYASPVVMVAKKTGGYRKCVDYRCLKKITVRDNYPLPRIEDCLDYLGGKKYFSTLDLKKGFFHVQVAEDCKKYTSFVTPFGQFEYNRMPFGLTNAPAVFQRYIHICLKSLIDSQKIIVYMDDILLATEDLETHTEMIKELMHRLGTVGLELNLQKCKFAYQTVDFLGYSVGIKGILPNDTHITAISNYPIPRTLKEVRTCLGLFSYFRKFIPNFAKIAHPLQRVLRTGVKFEIDNECEQAFQQLKTRLMTPPVLMIFERTKETELHTDASGVGFGAVLLQRQVDGKFHPISFYSKAASADVSRYHSFELEALAIVYALERFKNYLHGISFKIVTDCNALSLTFEKKNICPRIARWALVFQHFDFQIQHPSGVLMGHADALSRCYTAVDREPRDYHSDVMSRVVAILSNKRNKLVAEDETTDAGIRKEEVAIGNDEVTEDTMGGEEVIRRLPCRVVTVANQLELDFLIQVTQNRDENILALREQLEKGRVDGYELKDGLVFRINKDGVLQLYVPAEMEENVIRLIHEKICHFGIDKTCQQMKRNYWFKNMRHKVERYIRNCIRCIMFTPPARINDRNLFNIPKVSIPFDTLHVDHFGPLPSINSPRKHLFVIIDSFTKFVKLYAVKSTSTKEVIASLEKYFGAYSRPRRIISDRGTCFTSLEFGEFLLKQSIDHVKVAVASAQANGQVERVNRVLKTMLSKITDPIGHADWVKMLGKVEFAFNNSTHGSTKQTAAQLLFGIDQRGEVIDPLTEHLQGKQSEKKRRDLDKLRTEAGEAIKVAQETNLAYFKEHHKSPKTFSVVDFVVIRHDDTSVGTNKKFNERFRGPYLIHKALGNDRYVVRDVENCQITQLPYDGVIEASRIKKLLDPNWTRSPTSAALTSCELIEGNQNVRMVEL